MLSIPIKLDVSAERAEKALRDFFNGVENAMDGIVDLNGTVINFDVNMRKTGDDVVKALNDTDAATKKVTNSAKKYDQGVENSIKRAKFRVQQEKKAREALDATSKAYADAGLKIKGLESKLRSLQGIQTGSISDIKRQKSELVALRDATRINSPEFRKLTAEIAKFDKQLAATKPKANSFVSAFARIAVVSAGVQAVGGALRSVGNAVDVFVRRTKDVEGFSLALRNAGLEQGEVNRVFAQAETTANALGAPLAQVEKTYKRMIPALKSVGTSSEESDKFIEQISARTQTLGLNTEQSGRLLEAFAQVLSKGKLQAEELNQQISELDGAFRTQFAEALGVSTQALNELISDSQITADVFVATVNKMSNGAEALKKRILEGTATIQQFQNRIASIDTKNIEKIGKAIEPAIKSFLQIRLAVSEFIQSFSNSSQFELLVTIFNAAAKGLEQFVDGLLKAISAFGEFISPLANIVNFLLSIGKESGGLVGILVKLAGTITAVTLAVKGVIALGAGIKYVQQQFINLKGAITGSGAAAQKATPSMVKYGAVTKATGFAAASAAGKIKMIGKAIGKLALIAGAIAIIDKMIGAFTAGGKAAEEMNRRFSTIKLDFKDKLEELNEELDVTPAKNQQLGASLEEVTQKTETAGKANRGLGTTLGVIALAAGATAATVLTGGAALAAYGVAAAAGAGSLAKLAEAQGQLEKSAKGRAFLKNQQEITDAIKINEKEIGNLGAAVGQVDFSAFRGAGDDVVELSRRYRAQANTLKANISANEDLIRTERAKEKVDQDLIAGVQAKIAEDKKALVLVEKSAIASEAFVTQLIRQGNEAANAAINTEELAKATEKFIDELDLDVVNQQTEAIRRYGQEANAAELLAAANIGIAAAATERKIELYQKEIDKLNQKEQVEGMLNEKDKARQIELTELIAQENQKRTQLGIDARNAVIDAFEEGIARAREKTNVLGQSASALKSSFDGITNTFVGGLQAAGGLIDAIVSREIQGLEVGSAKRKAIIRAQLQAQARQIATEAGLARLKTQVQSRIAQSEAKIAQIRLRAEAAVAKARGQEGLAAELEKAAGVQGQIIEALQVQEEIDLEIIDINKQKQEQNLIAKGQQEKIGENAKDVANQIGVQVVSLQEANVQQKQLEKKINNYSKKLAKAATDAQDLKEASAETELQEGVDNAEDIAEALDDAQGAAEGLNKVMRSAKTSFNAVKGTGDKIVTVLKNAQTEARNLINLTKGNARAMGGPVTGGQQYTVNDGGGREAFLSNSGKFSMLPAARNIQWTAPSSGTIISAQVLKTMQRNQRHNSAINNAKTQSVPTKTPIINAAISSDSGSLAKQISSAMSGSTSNRITNNVTIQSQSPVTDASQLMTNVARMRLRNSRGI